VNIDCKARIGTVPSFGGVAYLLEIKGKDKKGNDTKWECVGRMTEAQSNPCTYDKLTFETKELTITTTKEPFTHRIIRKFCKWMYNIKGAL